MALKPWRTRSPIGAAVAEIASALDAVAHSDPVFMAPGEQAETLVDLAIVEARVAELKLRLLADAHQVAVDSGARDVGAWLAHQTHAASSDTSGALRLAKALSRRPLVAAALRAGDLSVAHVRVIVAALDALPGDLPADVLELAEKQLVEYALAFTPRQLTILGRKILEVVAPDLVEAQEGKRLADEEADAKARSKLTLRALGDGTTLIRGLIPDADAIRLTTYLDAFANPRRPEAPETRAAVLGYQAPTGHRAALAFSQFLETVDPGRLPIHGTHATTVVVTISWDALRDKLGTATIDGHLSGHHAATITAGEARRLACNASILPAILDGKSQVLDLGRERRLFSTAQATAIGLKHQTCHAEGCTIPVKWCQLHHLDPWSTGGRTDLANAEPLCARHHTLIHHHGYRHDRLADGSVRFHRRR